MNRELRMLVTRGAAERLLVDQLPEAIEEGGIPGFDRRLRQHRFKPERGKFFCGMRQQIDADPDRPDFGSRLENPAGDSGGVQRQPKRQPANAGSDDDDLVHVSFRHVLSGDCRNETRLVRPLSIEAQDPLSSSRMLWSVDSMAARRGVARRDLRLFSRAHMRLESRRKGLFSGCIGLQRRRELKPHPQWIAEASLSGLYFRQ